MTEIDERTTELDDRAPEPELDDHQLRHRWLESDRFVPRAFMRPAQRFMATEAAGAIVMLLAAVIAIIWANSPWQNSYYELWETPLNIELGHLIHIDLNLQEWVNDALMTIFFFVVSLEIKRELTSGELNEAKKAALPAVAALGGMMVPALIYLAFNAGTDAVNGWGIPVATDIAFAVGVVSLLGSRVPNPAKVFLLTLAIVDDVGGIIIIAIFYTDDLSIGWLAVAGITTFLMWGLTRVDVRARWIFLGLGLFLWLAVHESGVHATIAGVIAGLLTPAWSFYDPKFFARHARPLVDEIQQTFSDDTLTVHELEENESTINDLVRLSRESSSPVSTMLYALGPVVAFVIVPLFALANAGVTFTTGTIKDAPTETVVLGIFLGLVLGKAIGVFSATWLAVRLRIGHLPNDTSWAHVFGLAATAGIGFTVALFITGLAFTDPVLIDDAKVAIFAASIVAGIAGYLILRATKPVVGGEKTEHSTTAA